ncbi:MAG: HipA domain-containing protein [Planctomycetes bacterium]|nr:HipA domain-containing protein [Planctomycetota bacterium]
MNLAALKHQDVALVWKAGVRAARLSRLADGVVFEYEPDYRGPEVAFSLPRDVGVVRHAAGALPPFFSGLLPEGRRLSAIRAATKTSADDELTLLLAVGDDAIGDVRVLPLDAVPGDPRTDAHGAPPLAEADFGALFASAVGAEPVDRVAIAGAQDKVSGRMISLPVDHAGAAWLLKLDPPEFPGLVANEAFFLAAARDSGLEVADAEVVRDKNGRPGLLVRRFDRVAAGDRLVALAQEDACQVLGRYPADKYRFTAEQVVRGLAACTTAPVVAARTLLVQFAFAYLTCNGDAHAKNFSVLGGDEWRVAPAYDLPSTQPYGDHTMALSVGGKDREDIGRADFVALGDACGVPPKATARVLDRLLAAQPRWLERLDELPFDARRIHRLRQACRYRAARLAG